MKIANRAHELKASFNINKILINICWVQLIFIASILIFIDMFLLPNKDYRHYFLQLRDRSEQVVGVMPIQTTKKGIDMLKKQYVKQYVLDRESIDLQTENSRWNKLKFFHSSDVDREFANLMNIENSDSPLNNFSNRRITRLIQILSVINLGPEAPNSYRVEWAAHDQDKSSGETLQKQGFLSILTVVLEERVVIAKHEDINPIGFSVIKYTVQKQLKKVKI